MAYEADTRILPNRETPSERYERLLRTERDILSGKAKPEGLSAEESADWDHLAEEADAAAELGYIVSIPPD
jgi:hypothetical protein